MPRARTVGWDQLAHHTVYSVGPNCERRPTTRAWEVALRLSQIDLNNQDIVGGRLTDLTAGLNWYLTPYQRMKFNYILAHLDRGISSDTSIFGLRFDSDF